MSSAGVGKVFRFEAAHRLPHHDGKCARPHGHSYRVEVEARGDVKPANGDSDEGMVLDFGELSQAWRALHDRLDHRDLNAALPDHYHPTTAENIARFILDQMRERLPQVCAVRVWETVGGWAEVSA